MMQARKIRKDAPNRRTEAVVRRLVALLAWAPAVAVVELTLSQAAGLDNK